MSTPIIDLMTVLQATLAGDLLLAPKLEGLKVYSGRVPIGTRLPYITVTQPGQSPDAFLGRKKYDIRLQLGIWTSSQHAALDIWGDVERLLVGKRYILPNGEVMMEGTAILQWVLRDPSDEHLYHGPIDFSCKVIAA